MRQEREPQKEPVDLFCLYCPEDTRATWKVINLDGVEELVCDNHRLALRKRKAVQSDEEILWEAEWRLESSHEDYLSEHEFDDTDQWEDGSLYGF
jgi:hypothetical protein